MARAGRRVGRVLASLAALGFALPALAGASPGAPVLARTPAGAALMVTFADPPPSDVARARLAGLGDVSPVAPEAGVWALRSAPNADLRARVLSRPGVFAAEWALSRHSDDVTPTEPAAPLSLEPVVTPTDPLFTPVRQWGLFPGATTWGIDLTGLPTRPRIAILDSGVGSSHPEWSGPESPLVRPWSAWTSLQSAEDWGRTGHGTHVAGTAAAPANGVGIVGVAPARAGSAEVIPVQISDRDGYSTDETMMKGIRWAVANGAKVINISAGGAGYSHAFQGVINWAVARGALLVASVGNDGQDYAVTNYPAGYAHVLGVAAQCSERVVADDCPKAYGLARFSNRNASVDIVAPGVDILSSVPLRITEGVVTPGYAVKEGTSMAAPYVAGVAALVLATNPGATPYQVMHQLMNTATDMGAPGHDLSTGSGLINPRAAVTLRIPMDDPTEVNDDPSLVRSRGAIEASRPASVVSATLDAANDPRDLYPLALRKGESVTLRVSAPRGRVRISLWPPGTRSVVLASSGERPQPAAATGRPAQSAVLRHVANRRGRWLIEVSATTGFLAYRLEVGR